MGKICSYAQLVDEEVGLYLCSKYNSYCYFDEPNKKKCEELYGSEYTCNDGILDEEEGDDDEFI